MTGLVDLLVCTECLAHDTVSDFEARDVVADLNYLASNIAAEDEGEFDPAECEACALILHDPINRVDRHSMVPDNNFCGSRGRIRCVLDLKWLLVG